VSRNGHRVSILFIQYPQPFNLRLHLRVVKQAITFAQLGNIVNLSRIDPARLTHQGQGKNTSYIQTISSAQVAAALCLSPIFVTESHLHEPKKTTFVDPFKCISGILHAQEFERLAGVVGMVFNMPSMTTQLYASAITFGTRYASKTVTLNGNIPVILHISFIYIVLKFPAT
jgi:hypothetical protein